MDVGIHTADDLRNLGPVRAYLLMQQASAARPSLNFLYAMVGALENRHWTEIAQSERGRLLLELEGYSELEALIRTGEAFSE